MFNRGRWRVSKTIEVVGTTNSKIFDFYKGKGRLFAGFLPPHVLTSEENLWSAKMTA